MTRFLNRGTIFYRLPLICLLFLCYVSIAQAGKQPPGTENSRVTFRGVNVPIRSVFKAIREQTGLTAMFSKLSGLDGEEKVTVDFRNIPLEDALNTLFKGRDLEWKINDNVVVIRKKEAPALKKSDGDSSVTFQMVTGRITDAVGNELPGVTIIVKGTQQGAITDTDGKFSLANVTKNATLVISYVGYETREFIVKGKTILAQLNVDINKLDETVVVAYGTTTQRFNTGNVGSVKAKDIEKQPVTNPLLAIQGRIPGVFITQSTGMSNSGVRVLIQGQNSIGNGNDPFYVVDGVPYISQLLPNYGDILGNSRSVNAGEAINGNPLSFINPADIESIEVLKDADATAIYGSRAANGAILITTKKGKTGKTKVDINLQNGWGKVARRMKLLNNKEYLEMRHEALLNDGILNPSPTDYDLNGFYDTTRTTDWQKEFIGNTARYSDVQVSVSGGNSNTNFSLGLGYHRETTVFPGDFNDKKGSVHFSIINTSNNQKFKLQFSGNYLLDDNRLPTTDLTKDALYMSPVAPAIFTPEGNINWMPDQTGATTFYNPISFLYNKYRNRTNNLISNVIVSYRILPEVELKSSFGYTNLQSNETRTYPLEAVWPEDKPYAARTANYSNNNINSWVVEPQLTFKRKFGFAAIEALIGATFQQRNSNGQQMYGYGYNSDLVLEDIKSATNIGIESTLRSTYNYNAVFGRININAKDRYILNLSGRRDGSSRFGSQNLFHNFAAIGAAWLFSNEDFVKRSGSFLSFGKLRGSFGTTGNDQVGDYRFMNLFRPGRADIPYQGSVGLEAIALANPYLQWEETRKLQFGLELGFFADRIFINANYFRNRSSNQLMKYLLPITTGFYNIDRNFPATVQNSGWELSLSSTNIKTSKFTWTCSINFTSPKNKLVAFPNLETSPYANSLIIGKPVNYIKVFHFIGTDPTTGLFQFLNKDGKPTTNPIDPEDKSVFIDFSPQFYGGVQNTFNYGRSLQLDFLFQFSKQVGQNYSFGNYPGFFALGYGNQPATVLDRWKKVGDVARNQRFNSDYSQNQSFFNAKENSDGAWSDASYVRLKNVSLSWYLPIRLLNTLHLQSGRLYIQGQNLLTISGYKGLDPETRSTTSLPPLKVMTIGVQVSL